MRDYDWGFGFGFGPYHPARRRYGSEFRGYGPGGGGGGGQGRGGGFGAMGRGARGGYDRGVYGDDYPTFGGVPGGRERGMTYGGQGGGYGREPGRGGYGGGQRHAQEPFLPDAAYRRNPDLERQRRFGGWRDTGQHSHQSFFLDDDELEQAVRQSLFQDNWIDAESIEIEVSDGVVTLRGEVDDYLQARYAWDDVWETDGVRGVINHLAVRVDQPEGSSADTPEPAAAGAKAGKGGKTEK